jgi:hypothetical protein
MSQQKHLVTPRRLSLCTNALFGLTFRYFKAAYLLFFSVVILYLSIIFIMPPIVLSRAKRACKSTISSTIASEKRARTTASGTASQPIEVDTQLSHRPSPREALEDASQAILSPSPPLPPTFESRLRESQPKAAINAPHEASEVATIASELVESSDEDTLDARFADNFDGIDWDRLKLYMKPTAT